MACPMEISQSLVISFSLMVVSSLSLVVFPEVVKSTSANSMPTNRDQIH